MVMTVRPVAETSVSPSCSVLHVVYLQVSSEKTGKTRLLATMREGGVDFRLLCAGDY
jgi:hypothetical protein